MYIHIYAYMCSCVCVCIQKEQENVFSVYSRFRAHCVKKSVFFKCNPTYELFPKKPQQQKKCLSLL